MRNKSRNIVLGFMLSVSVLLSSVALADNSGHWVKKSETVNGTWSVETKNDGDYLILSDDFKTRNAPDLVLMLTNLSVADVNGKNAANGSLKISSLQSPKGGQSYKLPDAYHNYSTLLIHCEEYSKLWSASNFKLEAK